MEISDNERYLVSCYFIGKGMYYFKDSSTLEKYSVQNAEVVMTFK